MALAVAAVIMSSPTVAQPTQAGRSTGNTQLQAAATGGQIRGLAIGIDKYAHTSVEPLSGAVADAEDIARSLTRSGARDVTLLLNSAARRDAVRAALSGLASRATASDLVVIAFAGHGAQSPEIVRGSEPDGLDEHFVLWGFDPTSSADTDLVLDNEMRLWTWEIARTGAHVLFLADACFGGGMTKSVDPRANKLPVRALPRLSRRGARLAEDATPTETGDGIAAADNATVAIPNLSFIAAVDDRTLAPELPVKGAATPRGAASYALARALEGLADAEGNGDGLTTRRELYTFVRKHVRTLSEGRQMPVLEPRTEAGANVVLFRKVGTSPRVHAVPKQSPDLAGRNERSTPGIGARHLRRDPTSGDIIDGFGSVVAYGSPPTAFATALERAQAFEQLADLTLGLALDVSIEPAGRHFRKGEHFVMRVPDGLAGRHLYIVNLAGDGTVQFLFPRGRVDGVHERDRLDQRMQAVEPLGADTLIVIALQTRRPSLDLDLSLLDGKALPLQLVEAIARALDEGDRIGLATYTTVPR